MSNKKINQELKSESESNDNNDLSKYETEINNKYDELISTFDKIIIKHPKYTIKINDDSDGNNTLDVLNETKKIMSVKYELLGSYDEQLNLFYWACNHDLTNKRLVKLSKAIKKNKKIIKKKIVNYYHSDIEYLEKIYYYLSNSMFIITEKNIKKFLRWCLCVSEGKGILTEVTKYLGNNKPIVMYYIVTDIIGM
jgi:hypothetical protein